MPTSRLRPKKWEVIQRTTRPDDGVTVGNRRLKFGRQGAFHVSDPGVARELQKNPDVVVCEIDDPRARAAVSNSVFAQLPAMPWKKDERPWYERRKPLSDAEVNHETRNAQA